MGKKKKTKKIVKVPITLTADGFSFHTMELVYRLTASEWHRIVDDLYQRCKGKKQPDMRPLGHGGSAHRCTLLSEHGIRIDFYFCGEEGKYCNAMARVIVNPRKLLDSDSSYLGICPTDSKSFKKLWRKFGEKMEGIGLSNDIADYTLNRIDLCCNMQSEEAKVTREILRLIRKQHTPQKYNRSLYNDDGLTEKENSRRNKHYYCIKNDSVSLVVYDKTYQMTENDLVVAYEDLPAGVLRFEIQYGRVHICKCAEEYDCRTTQDTIEALARNSRAHMIGHFKWCGSEATYRKPAVLREMVKNSPFQKPTKKKMLYLVKELQRKQSVDAALAELKETFKLKDRAAQEILDRFDKLDVSPIPLRQNYTYDSLLSIPDLLEQVGVEYTKGIEIGKSQGVDSLLDSDDFDSDGFYILKPR